MLIDKIKNIFTNEINASKFIISITIFNMLIYHLPFYKYASLNLNISSENGILTLFSLLVALFVVNAFILFLMATVSLKFIKIFTIISLVTNSIAIYFVTTYNVIIDKTMMGNIFNTRMSEAMSYYDPKIFLYLIFFGIIPSLIVQRITLKKQKRLRLLSHAFITIIVGVFLLYLNSTTWLWLDKHSKIMGGLAMPWSYLINPIRYQLKVWKKSKKQILLPSANFINEEKMIVVLIIGESARDKNFSLYGYDNQTNPILSQMNVLVLKNTFSTTTYTTASINSMLSPTGSTSDSYEPLPNYLDRQGVDVVWRANNWGAPKLTERIKENMNDLREICKGSGCDYDEILLTNLAQRIKNSKKNKIFIVLHMEGSHGPTYFKKYPKEFEIFKPVCKSVDLKECTNQELVNAYDNSILYADHFIGRTINILKEIKDVPKLMMYISDHGESLGEYGLYLHGTPFIIAPDEQKLIPFILWQSQEFIDKKEFIEPYVKDQSKYGQNNIFHTVVGAFDINTTVYNKELDLLQK